MRIWPDNSYAVALHADFLASEYGRTEEAERCLRRAVELDPEDAEARYYLGKHLLKWECLDEARRELLEAARLGNNKARALLDSAS